MTSGKIIKSLNGFLQLCLLVQGHCVYIYMCVCAYMCACFVRACVCQRGNSSQGDIRCGWGSSLTTLKRGHHQRSCMTLGPSCISLWGLIILAGALLSRLCGPFHEHTKNTTPKYAGRRRRREKGERGGRAVMVAWVKVKKTQKKSGIKRREEPLFSRETAYLKKNRSRLDVGWLERWDVVIVTTIKGDKFWGSEDDCFLWMKTWWDKPPRCTSPVNWPLVELFCCLSLVHFGCISPCIVRELWSQKLLCCQGTKSPAVWETVLVFVWPHGKVLLVWNKYNKGAVDRCFNNRKTTDTLF